ncbi:MULTISPECIES: hypothetical protein [Streptomyces]|uniref:Uncharacterized protein n=1 Tax=Streptomyces chartreusis NRRL 3882 TaxID=1079985 RepID=A0A2N9B946_STRCX|nr:MULTISPECIES: hypothetical protein [Streptomyces]MYS94989.1 hypothetical protein [Streptomyces sp. SID5464]SOR79879.1 hypothetical protein SCNRRL3882_3338 [Streptomyces chartreusis NRRL 3882]
MDWYPDADEDLLLRTSARFAGGQAAAVAGCRWFRDPQRNDIQGELPGWPPGPVHTPRTTGDRAARRTGRALAFGIPLIANLVANIGGAAGSPFGSGPTTGKPEERENEVDDFPVMWAAPDTLARTVPWQLDPDRRPEGYTTDLVLTSRRLLFLGTRTGTLDKADVLAEYPRVSLAHARRMRFSEVEADVKVTFADGSWIRLFTGNPDSAERLAEILDGTVDALPESDLTPGQRDRVTRFLADLPAGTRPPTFTRLASGIVLVEARVPLKAGQDLHETHSILMGPSGEPAKPQPGDL